MNIYYSIIFFIIGYYLGDLYSVIGYRLPNKEKIIYPSINNSDNKINLIKLIPIINYFILKKNKDVSILNILFCLLSSILFLVCYLLFGISLKCLFSITFISMLLIIIVSDYYYMIICDEILVIFGIILLIEIYFMSGISGIINACIGGIVSFGIMFLIKIIGDFIFKKESMGGGDIKLLLLFGIVLGLPNSLFTIFIGSIIALPTSIISLKNNDSHILPFGPFLSMAAIILLLFDTTLSLLLTQLLF